MNNDKKAVNALKAAQTLIDYLNNEESFCSNTIWVDSKGYALHTDIGYLFEGLEKVADLLVKRCRGAIPEYPQSCSTLTGKGGKVRMNIKDKPNKVTATLRVVVTGEFYGDDATEEVLRYCVEQDLEDAGFEVDVSVIKPNPPREVITDMYGNYYCPHCSTEATREMGLMKLTNPHGFCPYCGGEVKRE